MGRRRHPQLRSAYEAVNEIVEIVQESRLQSLTTAGDVLAARRLDREIRTTRRSAGCMLGPYGLKIQQLDRPRIHENFCAAHAAADSQTH
jgi:hypothetical protein